MFSLCLLGFLFLHLGRFLVLAQNNSSTCLGSLDSANATGTVLFTDVDLVPKDVSFNDTTYVLNGTITNATYGLGYNMSYTMSVDYTTLEGYGGVDYPTLATSLLVGTPPDIDLYDGNNDWSACALIFTGIPLNTIERGQSDNGSCYQMLSEPCVNAITAKAANLGYYATVDPQSEGNGITNLTGDITTIMTEICTGILADNMGVFKRKGLAAGTNIFPEECSPYFEDDATSLSPSVFGFGLTSNVTPSDTCDIQTSSLLPNYTMKDLYSTYNNFSYSAGLTANDTYDDLVYDLATRSIFPILTVFMPQANSSRLTNTNTSSAHMTCPRVTRYSSGSRSSPALPAAKPVSVSHGLTSGSKAGIGVGVTLAILLLISLIGLYLYLLRKRQNAARNQAAELEVKNQLIPPPSHVMELGHEPKLPPEVGPGVQRHELVDPGRGNRVEMHGESKGGNNGGGEGGSPVGELEGQSHNVRNEGAPRELESNVAGGRGKEQQPGQRFFAELE